MRQHWMTDHHRIQRLLRRRWDRVRDWSEPQADALLRAESQLYERAADALEAGRRLFPLPPPPPRFYFIRNATTNYGPLHFAVRVDANDTLLAAVAREAAKRRVVICHDWQAEPIHATEFRRLA